MEGDAIFIKKFITLEEYLNKHEVFISGGSDTDKECKFFACTFYYYDEVESPEEDMIEKTYDYEDFIEHYAHGPTIAQAINNLVDEIESCRLRVGEEDIEITLYYVTE